MKRLYFLPRQKLGLDRLLGANLRNWSEKTNGETIEGRPRERRGHVDAHITAKTTTATTTTKITLARSVRGCTGYSGHRTSVCFERSSRKASCFFNRRIKSSSQCLSFQTSTYIPAKNHTHQMQHSFSSPF